MNDYEMGVAHRFAAFCKKVMKYSAYQWYAKRKKNEEREISLSLITEEYGMDFHDSTNYFQHAWHFEVQGMEVDLFDEDIAAAIKKLDPKFKDVILLYYFMGFNNEEIAAICDCDKRTVIRRKMEALNRLQKELRDDYEWI